MLSIFNFKNIETTVVLGRVKAIKIVLGHAARGHNTFVNKCKALQQGRPEHRHGVRRVRSKVYFYSNKRGEKGWGKLLSVKDSKVRIR